ncbi:MAG TPA: glycosyl transferase [Beijerinckiaceae bacterium]|jgi:UDP-N-acetylmuramyl pentapeptide phosphotransferase/UDP-N-acetylglucosamine-1-phosphate transferase
MFLAGIVILASAGLSAALILLLRPLLVRYALARPNARSSHKVPTPQGGGIAVVAATLAVAAPAVLAAGFPAPGAIGEVAAVFLAAIVLAALGAWDDLRPMPAAPRLAVQAAAVWIAVTAARGDAALFGPLVPSWLETAVLVIAGVWFVNLTNFMDGIDWMTVANFVPMLAAVAAFAIVAAGSGRVPPVAAVAAALLGALLGFAPFNKPVARLFLGDVGSLPIGLLVAWMLYRLALDGALVAALILPLYYAADATITLLRRLKRRERVWEAHRSHFYQQATDNGFSVMAVAGHVLALNLALAALAGAALVWRTLPMQLSALALGCVLTGLVLARFATPRRKRIAA